jgi:hypothetical protein
MVRQRGGLVAFVGNPRVGWHLHWFVCPILDLSRPVSPCLIGLILSLRGQYHPASLRSRIMSFEDFSNLEIGYLALRSVSSCTVPISRLSQHSQPLNLWASMTLFTLSPCFTKTGLLHIWKHSNSFTVYSLQGLQSSLSFASQVRH